MRRTTWGGGGKRLCTNGRRCIVAVTPLGSLYPGPSPPRPSSNCDVVFTLLRLAVKLQRFLSSPSRHCLLGHRARTQGDRRRAATLTCTFLSPSTDPPFEATLALPSTHPTPRKLRRQLRRRAVESRRRPVSPSSSLPSPGARVFCKCGRNLLPSSSCAIHTASVSDIPAAATTSPSAPR